jgi:hypothetical protein
MEIIVTVKNTQWTLQQMENNSHDIGLMGLYYNPQQGRLTYSMSRGGTHEYTIYPLDHQNILIKKVINSTDYFKIVFWSIMCLIMTAINLMYGIEVPRLIFSIIIWAVIFGCLFIWEECLLLLLRLKIQKCLN